MDSSSSEGQPVRVTILNQSYSLITKGDRRELEQLAQSINELMHSIAAKSNSTDPARIAVLACLHLADRLNSLEQDLARLKDRVDRKSEEFSVLLEQAIESGCGQ